MLSSTNFQSLNWRRSGHAESLAILEPVAAPGRSVGRVRQIDQQQRTSTASEALDFKLQESAANLADGTNPADQVARIVPAFNGARARRGFQHELADADLDGSSPGSINTGLRAVSRKQAMAS